MDVGWVLRWDPPGTGMSCWAWEASGLRWMGWVNIWDQVNLVFLRDEGGAAPQSITELLQCGLEDCLLE